VRFRGLIERCFHSKCMKKVYEGYEVLCRRPPVFLNN